MSRGGFVKIRAGLEDHLLAGRIGAFEVGVYLILHLQADFRTGIWTGSAPRIMGTAPRGASLRDIQRALKRLERIGFIRRFHRNGKRGNYRVLLHKYEPQFGALRGMRLNAEKSESWEAPIYEPCAVSDAVVDAVSVAVDAPYLEVDIESKKKKTSPAPAKEPSPAVEAKRFAFESFKARYSQPPSWGAGDYAQVAALFKRASGLTASEFQRRWQNYLDSTEAFTRKQGGSLKYFCTHFDQFISGPIRDASTQKGKTNGRDFGGADRAVDDVLPSAQWVA